MAASSRGKIELSMSEDTGDEDRLIHRLIGEAVKTVFDDHLTAKQFRNIVEYFETGSVIQTGDRVSSSDLVAQLDRVPGFSLQLSQALSAIEGESSDDALKTPLLASLAEFVLEALHCHNRLNKQSAHSETQYGL